MRGIICLLLFLGSFTSVLYFAAYQECRRYGEEYGIITEHRVFTGCYFKTPDGHWTKKSSANTNIFRELKE